MVYVTYKGYDEYSMWFTRDVLSMVWLACKGYVEHDMCGLQGVYWAWYVWPTRGILSMICVAYKGYIEHDMCGLQGVYWAWCVWPTRGILSMICGPQWVYWAWYVSYKGYIEHCSGFSRVYWVWCVWPARGTLSIVSDHMGYIEHVMYGLQGVCWVWYVWHERKEYIELSVSHSGWPTRHIFSIVFWGPLKGILSMVCVVYKW